ncbi:MAG: molybdate ABC transporter substrate-binding protein [Terracoccus sp.]
MSRPRALVASAVLPLAALLAACGTGTPATDGTGAAGAGPTGALSGTVTVLAAASLTDSFTTLAADFHAANPGVTVEPSYGASSTLVQQVNNGAPADVIALAGQSAAAPLDPTLVVRTDVFATNVLEIAVPPDNPGTVTGLADLGRTGLKVVLCAASVPCGKAADTTLAKAGVTASVVSRELDVKATLAKVRLGEADAAVVYRSDVVAAKGSVRGIPVPDAVNTTLRYPIIALDREAATSAFVAYVLSRAGEATVQSFGLGAP